MYLARTASHWQMKALRDGSLRFLGPTGREVTWRWVGAAESNWALLGAAKGATTYHLGKDSARWFENIPSHAKIERTNLYPGIDFILYGAAGELEYDLIVHPGADPCQVRLEVTGGWLDSSGNIATEGLLQRAPYTYQDLPDGRKRVASRFVETGHKWTFRLEFADYQRDLPLVIDPIISGRTIFTGDREDLVVKVLNSAVLGYTRSTQWDRPSGSGDADVFLRQETGGMARTTYWGGSGDDIPTDLADGGTYIVGYTNSPDFPTVGAGAQTVYGGGATDGFLINMNPYATLSSYVGGVGDDRLTALSISSGS